MLSISEYKANTRGYYGEEFFDFLFYRPLAYVTVKLTYALPLTPNLFSGLGLIFALYAAWSIYQGTPTGFLHGAVSILLFGIFDCCDGLLARMKKNSSMLGELIDMIVDLIASIGFYTCTYLGFQKYEGEQWWHLLIFLAGVAIFIHASIYHYYKKLYNFYKEDNPQGRNREIENYSRRLKALPKSAYHKRFLIRFYLLYTSMQTAPTKTRQFKSEDYLLYNKPILPLWGAVAGSTHLTVLALSLMMKDIRLYLFFAFIFANIWLLLIFLIQTNINKEIEVRA